MNKYEAKYNEIVQNGVIRDQDIAGTILKNVENEFKTNLVFYNASNMSNTMKLMTLMASQYRDYVIKLSKENDYNLRFELYYLLLNLCKGVSTDYIKYYNSIISCEENNVALMLNTVFGKTNTFKLNRIMPELRDFIISSRCHDICKQFIECSNEYQATTALLDSLFGGKQYHSFIENDDYVLDLAANMFIKKKDYYQLFNPIVLNSINKKELKTAEEEIDSKEDIGKDKCLLLRLAVNKQVK